MEQYYQNRVNMWRTVLNILDANTAVWSKIPAMVMAHDQLAAIIRMAEAAGEGQQAPTTGITTDKSAAEHNAILLVLDLAGAAKAYASSLRNNTLHASVNYTYDDLIRLPDSDLYARLEAMLAAITPYTAALAGAGVTPGEVGVATTAVATYHTQLEAPRTAIVERSTDTQSVPALAKQARLLLNDIDGLVRRFRLAAPAFISDYKNARIVVDAGRRHKKGPDDKQKDDGKKDDAAGA